MPQSETFIDQIDKLVAIASYFVLIFGSFFLFVSLPFFNPGLINTNQSVIFAFNSALLPLWFNCNTINFKINHKNPEVTMRTLFYSTGY